VSTSRKLIVPAGAPERLDRFLAAALGISRQRVKSAIEAGDVRVAGRPAKKGDAVRTGMEVEVRSAPERPAVIPQPELPLKVLYEDPAMVVLDKPAGQPTHPLDPGELGTLANALAARYPDCAQASTAARECGLVHRLDTGTSGAIAAARTSAAYLTLRESFRKRQVEKHYLALVGGSVGDTGEVELPLANDPEDRRRVLACGSPDEASRLSAEEALTRYRVRERLHGYYLLEVQIVTGVRHQIRAHLAAIGAPVVGDELYGGPRLPGLERLFLHAARLALPHPQDGHRVEVESPLPPELVQCLAGLSD
jgi:23S rRNA pseudouridine1911/1915/1917 synthase